ncbi:MAG: hypothetical protein DCC58_20180, partial [Chloroflexi bacterium]
MLLVALLLTSITAQGIRPRSAVADQIPWREFELEHGPLPAGWTKTDLTQNANPVYETPIWGYEFRHDTGDMLGGDISVTLIPPANVENLDDCGAKRAAGVAEMGSNLWGITGVRYDWRYTGEPGRAGMFNDYDARIITLEGMLNEFDYDAYEWVAKGRLEMRFYCIQASPTDIVALDVWTGDADLAATDAFLETFRFVQFGRRLVVTAYDGHDYDHFPLAYDIRYEELDWSGLDGAPVWVGIEGAEITWYPTAQPGCLADYYDVSDPATGRAVRAEVYMPNVTRGDVKIVTGKQGKASLRLYFNYAGKRVGSFGAPCALPKDIEVMFEAPRVDPKSLSADDPAPEPLQAPTKITLDFAAYIMAVEVKLPATPQIVPPGSPPMSRPTFKNVANLDARTQAQVYSRIFIDDVPFVNPDDFNYAAPVGGRKVYILPLALGTEARPGSVLTLDMSYTPRPIAGSDDTWSPPGGTAIAVQVAWIDGHRAWFIAENRENIRSPKVHLIVAPNMKDIETSDPRVDFLYFIGTEGLELVGEIVTVAAATAINPLLGGAVAAAWGMYEIYDTPGDLMQVGDILSRNGYMVIIQSKVALTLADDGTYTLTTYEGSPGILDRVGTYHVLGPGDMVDIANYTAGHVYTGPAPERADELLTLLETTAGSDDPLNVGSLTPPDDTANVLPAATPTVTGGGGTVSGNGEDGSAIGVLLVLGLGALLVVGAIAVLVSLARRGRAPAVAAGTPTPVAAPTRASRREGARGRPAPPAARATTQPQPPRASAATSPVPPAAVAPRAPRAAATTTPEVSRCGVCGAQLPD